MKKKSPARKVNNVCVFSSSSELVDRVYFKSAREFGVELARKGYRLVYGGGNVGLMGETARAVHQNGGDVLGIIPRALHGKTAPLEALHELIVTEDMRARKTLMEKESDAFVALPGGFGTLEELFEMITLRQLHYHDKPIVIANFHRFYDPMVSLFSHVYEQKFAHEKHRRLYRVVTTVKDAFLALEGKI